MKAFLAEAWKMGGLWDVLKRVAPYLVSLAGGSKKIAVLVASWAVAGLVAAGLPLTPEMQASLMNFVLLTTLAALGALGLTDMGKEKAALELAKEKVLAEALK